MAKSQTVSVQRLRYLPELPCNESMDMLDDDEDFSLYALRESLIDLSDEISHSNVYNELDVAYIYRSLGLPVPASQSSRNNAGGRNLFMKSVNCGTQTKHEIGNAPLSWIAEMKDKTDYIYMELSNIVNTLLHPPYQSRMDKTPKAANSDKSSLLNMKPESSGDQNKNMSFWLHENGAWKSRLHPEIQIPCTLAAKDACSSKEAQRKEFEEKVKSLLKTVVEMKNLIPALSDTSETQHRLSDDSASASQQDISVVKLDCSVQTENACVDAATSTAPWVAEDALPNDLSDHAKSVKMIYPNLKSSKIPEPGCFVSDLSGCKSESSVNVSEKDGKESSTTWNKLLTPVPELLGTYNAEPNTREVTTGAGEGLYTFPPDSDDCSMVCASGVTVSKSTVHTKKGGGKNDRGASSISSKGPKKPLEGHKLIPKLRCLNNQKSDKPENALNCKFQEAVCANYLKKSRAQMPTKDSIAQAAGGNGAIQKKPTVGAKNIAQSSSEVVARKNAKGPSKVNANASKNKILKKSTSSEASCPVKRRPVEKSTEEKFENVVRQKTGITVTNCSSTMSVAGPSRERPKKEDRLRTLRTQVSKR